MLPSAKDRSKRTRHGQPSTTTGDVRPVAASSLPSCIAAPPPQTPPRCPDSSSHHHHQPQSNHLAPHQPPSPRPASPPRPASSSSNTSDNTSEVCWICLDNSTTSRRLVRPCACPRYAHAKCLARWQLQSAGTRRETHCDFCGEMLPDWKQVLTVAGPTAARAPAVMTVSFNGRTFFFHVEPGEEGYRKFTADVKAAFTLPDDCDLNITFTCDEPATGGCAGDASGGDRMEDVVEEAPRGGVADAPASLLTLQGAGAYDAAVHCAAISAAKRLAMRQAAGRSASSRSQR